ncbi:MAG TPA: efflux RND transporter periplasmic adaptor subunit [Phycisphaerae bacterium]
MKKLLLLLVVVTSLAAGGAVYWRRARQPAVGFRSAPVKHADLLVTISATGTVEPEEVVDVGAQVAGKVKEFGKAPGGRMVDYGTPVDEGTILAQIDDALYQADVAQSSAQLEQAKASVLRAQADLEQMQAKLVQAEQNWKRAQELGPSRALSATDYESYQANYETAKATVGVGEATVVQAQKAVMQAQASLDRSQTNLGYCTIKSPVKGVIIDRRVNMGQTVVASLNAPSLFLIAKDLNRMQVWAAVNEADIGKIHPGQPVRFSVDAYAGQTFHGEVGKIRLNASMTQNVVTYTVEILTDNSDGKLLPYLTANVQFEVAQRENVLTVPNAALRWTPATEQIAPDARTESAPAQRRANGAARSGRSEGGGRRAASQPAQGEADGWRPGTLWISDGTFVRPVAVRVGLTDGLNSEIESGALDEGREVVIGEAAPGAAAGAADTKNPFIPQPFRNRRPGG